MAGPQPLLEAGATEGTEFNAPGEAVTTSRQSVRAPAPQAGSSWLEVAGPGAKL